MALWQAVIICTFDLYASLEYCSTLSVLAQLAAKQSGSPFAILHFTLKLTAVCAHIVGLIHDAKCNELTRKTLFDMQT